MSQQGSLYNTVMSYVPGTEDYRKSTQHSEEEHHTKSTTPGGTAGTAGTTTGHTSGQDASGTDYDSNLTGAGKTATDVDYGTGRGSDSTTGQGAGSYSAGQGTTAYDSGKPGSGYTAGGGLGSTVDNNQTGSYGTKDQDRVGSGISSGDYGAGKTSGYNDNSRTQLDDQDTGYGGATRTGAVGGTTGHSNFGAETGVGSTAGGYGGTGVGYGGGSTKPNVEYEDADDTGTHHSGYNPKTASQASDVTQGQDDGVRGAPIEGENVKGYAIGSQVGSGDTENPTRPGDPSGQVAGSHLEYGPKATDTRDGTGRGTVGQSQGTGDSSFANVKTTDGKGNSSHVVTRQSTSHMTSSSVTQL